MFLKVINLGPSKQLVVPEYYTTSLVPVVALPLSELQMETAYSLFCTLRQFCCANPGVLDSTAALVQLPPVGDDARSPYQVPPLESAWPIPHAVTVECDESSRYSDG
jgi:hypothetical protein